MRDKIHVHACGEEALHNHYDPHSRRAAGTIDVYLSPADHEEELLDVKETRCPQAGVSPECWF
ncbi:MAG: hypothetical protein ACT4R6_10445 [Gemmatimonadaceae bacterium]